MGSQMKPYTREKDYYVRYDMIEGETIQRIVSPNYPNLVAELRTKPVDFSVCDDLIQTISRCACLPDEQWECRRLRDALHHLRDAKNEQLPLHARETHFDIAGSCAWDARDIFRDLGSWIGTWKLAGGV
jgi:hypothetical protein